MTQEEKKLIEVELATRSQYGVICAVKPVAPFHELEFGGEHKIKNIFIIGDNDFTNFSFGAYQVHGVENIKPYLRPLSSMTYEEMQDAREKFFNGSDHYDIDNIGEIYADTYQPYTTVYTLSFARLSGYIDWLNEHHFDYRGLIYMGLALEAPKDMYKTE